MSRELSRLLEHPAIWRGRSAARMRTLPTGFHALDESLPGGGWPQTGLIEILPTCFGAGELALLLPALAMMTRRPEARWCAWVAPPLQPFAPALAECGVALERVLVVQARRGDGVDFPGRRAKKGLKGLSKLQRSEKNSALWAFEQTLRSGACDIALAWVRDALPRQVRRLHLAAERGSTLGVLFRPREAASDSSPAVLRVAVEPVDQGGVQGGDPGSAQGSAPGSVRRARVTLLKSRGGARGAIDLDWR